MNISLKKSVIIILALALSVMLFACEAKPAKRAEVTPAAEVKTDPKEAATTAPAEEEAAEIEIESGGKKIMVKKDPKKVVSLDLASIDILDELGKGSSLVGMPKATMVKYLESFYKDESVKDLGSLKEIDMEGLAGLKPDLIILGSRQRKRVAEFEEIAPTILISIDNKDKGYIKSFKENVTLLAKIFGEEEKAKEHLDKFDERIAALKAAADGKTALVTLATKNNLNVLGPDTRGSIISKEIGFKNDADVSSTHGDNVSFEFIVDKNPEYLFVLDRDTAINAKGSKNASEIVENELIKGTDAYKQGRIVYLTPDVWYLAEGGIKSTDIMLKDLEDGILK